MRSYGMYDASRGLTLGFAAALAGLALWGATQVGTQTDGRFWIAMAIVAAAGLLLALASHVGMWTKGLRLRLSPTTFVLAFLPVLVCVGWILIASQPGHGWQEARILHWSDSIGVVGLVHSVGLWRGVLALSFGLILGLCFDAVPAPEVDEAPAHDGPEGAAATPAADEPVTAEQRSYGRRPAAPAERPMDGETAQTRERTPVR
jgi:hypothetical protein